MITKHGENTKGETPRVWGNQEAVQFGADGNGCLGTRRTSSQAWSEPISASGDDWTGRDSTGSCGQTNAGGIVERLIAKVAILIEESEHRTAELKEQLTELINLSQHLKQSQNIDDEE